MPTTDPIADMLTRIRNANSAVHDQVDIPASKLKEQIAKVLKREGFIKDFQVIQTGVQGVIRVFLKYGPERERVINGIKRVSRPGLRVYVGTEEIPRIFGGLGTVVMSTPKGVLTGKQARRMGIGGEVLAYVW
ncbi:MAG: 30S ribosomal protein S8 [Burkholderiales bacterium]|mgnify:CR=1 FL=1|jgi:small subunit ribosomal protein S8|nr:30S ribosomal protein S8 [Burkholderiales bacterium]